MLSVFPQHLCCYSWFSHSNFTRAFPLCLPFFLSNLLMEKMLCFICTRLLFIFQAFIFCKIKSYLCDFTVVYSNFSSIIVFNYLWITQINYVYELEKRVFVDDKRETIAAGKFVSFYSKAKVIFNVVLHCTLMLLKLN